MPFSLLEAAEIVYSAVIDLAELILDAALSKISEAVIAEITGMAMINNMIDSSNFFISNN